MDIPEGFTPHDGKSMPYDRITKIDVVYGNGNIDYDCRTYMVDLLWEGKTPGLFDIVGHRLHVPPATAESEYRAALEPFAALADETDKLETELGQGHIAAFIAASRSAVPALIADWREMRAEIDELRASVKIIDDELQANEQELSDWEDQSMSDRNQIAALNAENERLRRGLKTLATTFYKEDQHQDYARHILDSTALEAKNDR